MHRIPVRFGATTAVLDLSYMVDRSFRERLLAMDYPLLQLRSSASPASVIVSRAAKLAADKQRYLTINEFQGAKEAMTLVVNRIKTNCICLTPLLSPSKDCIHMVMRISPALLPLKFQQNHPGAHLSKLVQLHSYSKSYSATQTLQELVEGACKMDLRGESPDFSKMDELCVLELAVPPRRRSLGVIVKAMDF
jgi:hypothetical protein